MEKMHGKRNKDVGMTWVDLSKKAQDRDLWRRFVCGLSPDRGERQ